MAIRDIELENNPIDTDIQTTKIISTPGGHKIRAVTHGNTTMLVDTKTRAGVNDKSITVIGDGVSASIVGDIFDVVSGALKSGLGGLTKVLSCTPVQTTVINMKDGKVTGVTVTNTCQKS